MKNPFDGVRTPNNAFVRRGLSAVLAVSVLMTGLTVSRSFAQTAGTPLLAIGLDVISATPSTVTYRINARNAGNGDATKVRVSLPVPGSGTSGFGNMTFESSSPVDGSPPGAAPTCDNGGTREPVGTSCQWLLGTMSPGASRDMTVVFNLPPAPTASGRTTVSATASATGVNPTTNAATNSPSDTDSSLARNRFNILQDTFVDSTKPANTNYGACPTLTIASSGTTTAYVDPDAALPSGTGLETMLAAHLDASVAASDYSDASPGTLALHPITSGQWTQGTGTCPAGAMGSGDQVRTGTVPGTTTNASATAPVRGLANVRWDVTNDLDGAAERTAFQGWQVRNVSGFGSVDLHSADAIDTTVRPRLILIYVEPETVRCIDADPDFRVDFPSSEQVITAVVTDGATGAKIAAGGNDACNGTPVTGQLVTWNIDWDTPDIYISNQAGAVVPKSGPTSAGPNTIQTTTDQNGTTFIGVRLGNQEVFNGQNRVAACSGNDPTCSSAMEPETVNGTCQINPAQCTGENQTEDDTTLQWSSAGAPTTPPSSSTPTPTPSQSASPTQPSGSTSPPPSTPAASTPGGTVSPAGRSLVGLTLASSAERSVAGNDILLSGELSSDNAGCAQAGTTIEVLQREAEATTFEHLAYVTTGVGGLYEHTVAPDVNTIYLTSIGEHGACEAASSTPLTVLVAPEVTAKSRATKVVYGRRFWITGSLLPEHQLTPVTLWRKLRLDEFEKIGKAYLDASSRYSFSVRYKWKKLRSVFIVRWKATDADHISGNSAPLRIERA